MLAFRYVLIILFSCLFFPSRATVEKPLVVVICCYNNIKWVKNNLDSVLKQVYENYRIIFVDDGSTDGTANFVQNYITTHQLEHKFTFIANKKRRRKLANLYRALYLCKPEEIVVLVDGDDWLAHKHVFKLINDKYDSPDIWFTYGQYKNEPVSEAHKWGFSEYGYSAPVSSYTKKNQAYRRAKFVFMHLRTFYAWLFQQIKLEDLIAQNVRGFEGDFYPASNDLAIFIPMVEMAHTHIHFIPDILYIRNLYSNIVGFKVDSGLQWRSAREIRRKKPYQALKEPVIRNLEPHKHKKASVLLFASHSLRRSTQTIGSLINNVIGIKDVVLLYPVNKDNITQAEVLEKMFEAVTCIPYDPQFGFKEKMMEAVNSCKKPYILCTTDEFKVIDLINLGEIRYWLERTYAHGFYLANDLYCDEVNKDWLTLLEDNIYTWKFYFSRGEWKRFNNFNMTVYKKETILKVLKAIEFDTPAQMRNELKSLPVSTKKVGLFYERAKVEHALW